jgi:hypothetical protein
MDFLILSSQTQAIIGEAIYSTLPVAGDTVSFRGLSGKPLCGKVQARTVEDKKMGYPHQLFVSECVPYVPLAVPAYHRKNRKNGILNFWKGVIPRIHDN